MIIIPTSQTQETLLEVFAELRKLLTEESTKHFMRLQMESTTTEQLRFSSGFVRGMAFALRLLEIGDKQARETNEISFLIEDDTAKDSDVIVSASV